MTLKAVLLAAGKSTRTHPLTLTRPKPLLKIANKTILQHNLEQLEGIADEVIIVVGYKKEMVKQHFGKKFNSIKITYAEQKEQLGTGHAMEQVKDLVGKRFIIMNADDLYFKEDIQKLLDHRNAALVKQHNRPEKFGVYVTEGKKAKKIIEKPEEFVSGQVNIGCYIFENKVFDIKLKKSSRGEYEITDYVSALIKNNCFFVEKAENWFPIVYAWDLLAANEFLLSEIKKDVQGETEENVVVKGEAVIGKDTLVKSGTYIEGPVIIGENCTIGPNAYLRGSTSIGNNCKVGHEVEIKNSIIFDNTALPHLSYVGDSVVGENANIAAGSITANFRHDKGLIRSSVKKELVDTGLNKLGAVIGDNTRLGIRTLIYPGRKIWPNKTTLPGEIVKKDLR